MGILGNVIWLLFLGGFWSWILWLMLSALSFISIIGIPWGRACYNISELAATPFGKEAIDRRQLTQIKDVGTSAFGFIGNIIWFVLVGIWVAIAHTAAGILCCVTLIGIPFGIQHFKLAGLAVAPIGKAIVSKELANQAREENAKSDLEKLRSGIALIDIKQ